jgi:hypothetical protein
MRRLWMIVALAGLGACASPTGGGTDAAVADAGVGPDALDYPDARPNPTFAVQFVDPDHGPFAGGTEVMVRGNGFSEGVEVYFGGRQVDPIHVNVIDSRRIEVLTPPGQPGPAEVEVAKLGTSATLANGYTYEALQVDPPSGSVAGGTFVSITGFGTEFDDGTQVFFDGQPLVQVEVANEQSLTGFSPPGVAGRADVLVVTGAQLTYEANDAFTYQTTADPFAGGMGGGPINGEVNVVVINAYTNNGVDGAFVALGDPATTPFKGFADDLGQITFSDPSLVGPITTTAAAEGYETTQFIGYDARDITIKLYKPPEPSTGPFPPGPQAGAIHGHVLFGASTGLGSPHWHLVPEPRTPTEVKRVYVTTTAPSVFGRPFAPLEPIDYAYDPDVTAWEFTVVSRPSATAVVAVAGLYDPAKDPSGTGTTGFEPFAMGVARGVLVGPGEVVTGIDVVIDIPLDTALRIDLDRPPARNSPGHDGPGYYTVKPFIDLGGEGAIALNKHGLPFPPVPEPWPNVYRLDDDGETITLGAMAPLTGSLADASYTVVAGAYTDPNDSAPFSIRIARGITEVGYPIEVGAFTPIPRPADPGEGAIASGRSFTIAPEPPADGDITYNLHLFRGAAGEQYLRVFTRGDILTVDLPDLSVAGLPPVPGNTDLSWTTYSIDLTGVTFDQFTYRHLSALYFDGYAADAWWVQFPN